MKYFSNKKEFIPPAEREYLSYETSINYVEVGNHIFIQSYPKLKIYYNEVA